jgi:MFS transporter, DHA2 family, multidrug resistance protein
VISLGFGPVFGLTTELIVGSAPPERAGAASGMSETGSELGGALGIAMLGSIGVALYRSGVANELPDGVPASAAAAARDTLGGAVGVARELPEPVGAALLQAAREAFVLGMQVTSAISLVVAIGVAVLALVALRNVGGAAAAEAGEGPPTATDVDTDAEPARAAGTA